MAKEKNTVILPRIIRLRDASDYVGASRNLFNAEIRPMLTEIPIGRQGVGFDRLELDAWVDDYKTRNGRPGWKGNDTWDANACQASSDEATSGISEKRSKAGPFNKALAQIALKKPK